MALTSYDTSLLPLEILYADEHIVVVNKPYGLLSVPSTNANLQDSVTSRLQKDYAFVEAVHRLDMATSGILVCAVSKIADQELKAQFRNRQTSKSYFALVRGQVVLDKQFIDLPLACDWPLRPRQRVDFETGKFSLTECEVIERNPYNNTTLVRLTPHTGRTHQLRVHLQAIGHPIVGDKFYDPLYRSSYYFRLCLHAASLGFMHPATKKELSFQCPPQFALNLGLPEYEENAD